MSVHISHSLGISKVSRFQENGTYLLKYPCQSPSECSQYTIYFTPGSYLLEAYGSQGSSPNNSAHSGKGGNGGYSAGVFRTTKNVKLYLHVGAFYSMSSGYNGGGDSNDRGDGRGGGATDFRTLSGKWDENLDSRILVAAGGGGAWYMYDGGNGGGLVGEAIPNGQSIACVGTQDGCVNGTTNRVGVFGKGVGNGFGAGGGGYYGGGSANSCGGGGGSGYIDKVESSPIFQKITSTSSHTGYGEARITILELYFCRTVKHVYCIKHFIFLFIVSI